MDKTGRCGWKISINRQILKIIPGDFIARDNRGINHCLLKKLARCPEDISRAMEIDPKFFPAHLDRGQAYEAPGDREASIDDPHRAGPLKEKVPKTLEHWTGEGVIIIPGERLITFNRRLS